MNTSNNFKALFMGILLMAATFLVASSIANGPTIAFAQSGNDIVGCARTVEVTLSGLPNQTSDASAQVALHKVSDNSDRGNADINIPGIGSGHVQVTFQYYLPNDSYNAQVSDIPGQVGGSSSVDIKSIDVCINPVHPHVSIGIPGIGSGTLIIYQH